MDDYISREKVLEIVNEFNLENRFDSWNDYSEMHDIISELEATDVQPVRHGRWEYYKNNGIFDIHKCSACGTPFELPMDVVPSSVFCFCPHCGADMRGDTQ